jgi:hypothetical protein
MMMREKKYMDIRTTFLACLFAAFSIVLSGCIIGDRITGPVKISGKPNTFKHNLRSLDEKVVMVEVLHSNRASKVDTLAWKIQAKREIPGWGFTVTVGQIPDGFEQVTPTPPVKFRPVPGEQYIIFIGTKPASVHAFPAIWTAEPSNERE